MKLAALALLAATACASEPDAPEGPQVTSYVEKREIPMASNTQIDVLFVVDNSPAMAAAQTKLAADYRAMAAVLEQSYGGAVPDLHLGVISTDLADQGHLHGGAFLADATRFAWRRESNYDGALADNFVSLATVGAAGSSDTRPITAMQRALSLDDAHPGFFRQDAYLAIVFLTAGDDHGTEDVAAAASWLKSIKSDPAKVLVTGAFGACDDAGIIASPAPRLAAFLDKFPNRSASTTLCSDLRPLVALTSQLYRTTLGIPCVDNVRVPHDCASWLVDPDSGEELRFPECAGPNDTRCWTMQRDAGCIGESEAILMRPHALPFSATAVFECVADAP